MMCMSSRRGSALLIVLGMLAFMVASAIAFSAYMRSSRLPSSYLRRVVSSRMLVKAALAEAIDEIDAAVGNYPHPGVWINNSALNAGGNQNFGLTRDSTSTLQGRNSNAWLGRVYIGGTSEVSRVQDRLIPQNETVPTLSLEALAYIPPPLVNEARYYSRHSNAATWHTMGFDAGRYAFCALDVSDFFDINAMTAGLPRNSSPGGRISLAYLFENQDHSKVSSKGSAWDTFIDQYVNDVPLISMADWNLAMGLHTYGEEEGIKSYFYQFANGNVKDKSFYNGAAADDQSKDEISRMSFVTDGWFPETNAVGEVGDIYNKPPFLDIEGESESSRQPSFHDIITGNSPTRKLLGDTMNYLTVAMLRDYLDKNDIPVSLALPTVERVPMLTALESRFKLSFKPSKIEEPSNPEEGWQPQGGEEQERIVTRSYRLEIGNDIDPSLGAMWMFPFLRDNGRRKPSFSAEIAVRIGFASKGAARYRVSKTGSCSFSVMDKDDFIKQGIENGVIKLKKTITSLDVKDNVLKASDAIIPKEDITLDENIESLLGEGNAKEVFRTVWKQKRKKKEDGNWEYLPEEAQKDEAKVNLDDAMYPFDQLSAMQGNYKPESLYGDDFHIEVVPYMTITARVKKGNDTVDLVPANWSDDREYNNVDNDESIAIGSGYPLLTMIDKNGSTLDFSPNGFEAGKAITVEFQPTVNEKSVYCPDPRWNFAPENFAATDDRISNIRGYYEGNAELRCGAGQDRRDGDIFMGVSNQGILQSVSEIAFLVRTIRHDNDISAGDDILGDTDALMREYQDNNKTMFPKADNGNLDGLAHGKLMWRTYRLYGMDNGDGSDDLYGMGLYAPSKGFAVSPFSDATNVFMAAFANTPTSWWAAYEDNEDIDSSTKNDAAEFNQRYAFNVANSNAKFDWNDLYEVARNIMYGMRNAGYNWQQAYDNMDWAGASSDFCGVNFTKDTDDLYEVDRKMLYGFWRDCFAVKQQLFLIFVRAEPTMMGGGAIHQTPPQLGARAVALVWRDPNRSGQTGPNGALPHRTRVLFYRQFD